MFPSYLSLSVLLVRSICGRHPQMYTICKIGGYLISKVINTYDNLGIIFQ
jgi:hypothetical protein